MRSANEWKGTIHNLPNSITDNMKAKLRKQR